MTCGGAGWGPPRARAAAAGARGARLAVLADQGAWLASWGPQPGEPGCRVPPALLPETQARREHAYLLWRSAVRTSVDKASESKTARQPRSRRRDDTEQTARPRTRRGGSPAPEPEPGGW